MEVISFQYLIAAVWREQLCKPKYWPFYTMRGDMKKDKKMVHMYDEYTHTQTHENSIIISVERMVYWDGGNMK